MDLQWKRRLLKKHSSEDELENVAKKCFANYGDLYAHELISLMKQKQLLKDFLVNWYRRWRINLNDNFYIF